MDGLGEGVTVQTSQGASDTLAPGCTVTYDVNVVKAFFNTKQTAVCCGQGVTELSGKASALIDVEMSVANDATKGAEITLTLTGPASVWYGAGFFAQVSSPKDDDFR